MVDVPSQSRGLISGVPAVARMARWLAIAGPGISERSTADVAQEIQATLRATAEQHDAWAPHAASIDVHTSGEAFYVEMSPAAEDLEYGTATTDPLPLVRPLMQTMHQNIGSAYKLHYEGWVRRWKP